MKRSRVAFAIIATAAISILIFAFMAPQWIGQGFNWGIITATVVGLAVIAFFLEFESRHVNTKELALISIMGTLAAIVRIPFAPIPNAQPATFIIICIGYTFGPMAGFMTGAITALVSNFFLGHGPWTIFQILGWGLAGFTAGILRNLKPNIWVLAAFGLVWGFIFGIIMNIWHWASLIYPLTWQTFLITQLNSIWFDTIHGVATALFILILGKRTIAILKQWHNRFFWKNINNEPKNFDTSNT